MIVMDSGGSGGASVDRAGQGADLGFGDGRGTHGRVGKQVGRHTSVVQNVIFSTGGVRPPVRRRAVRQLTLCEREDIAGGVAAGLSVRAIAGVLGRAPSTVSRELARNGGRRSYRPSVAERAAWDRAARPKTCKLASNPVLREHVIEGLGLQWSPEQITGWLKAEFPDDAELRVSHETIYLSLFVQSKGLLNKELSKQLRSGRAVRRAGRISVRGQERGQIVDALPISERPPEADDRAVPGHWEGDMVSGSGNTHPRRWSSAPAGTCRSSSSRTRPPTVSSPRSPPGSSSCPSSSSSP